jgi:hypothetical protein
MFSKKSVFYFFLFLFLLSLSIIFFELGMTMVSLLFFSVSILPLVGCQKITMIVFVSLIPFYVLIDSVINAPFLFNLGYAQLIKELFIWSFIGAVWLQLIPDFRLKSRKTLPTVIVFILTIAIILGIFIQPSLNALAMCKVYFQGIILFFWARYYTTIHFSKILILSIACITLVHSCVGLYQYFFEHTFIYSIYAKSIFLSGNAKNILYLMSNDLMVYYRTIGLVSNSNPAGLLSCIGSLLFMHKGFKEKRMILKLIFLLLFLVQLAALILTFTRGAWIGFFIGSFIIFKQTNLIRLYISTIGILTAVVLFFSGNQLLIINRLMSLSDIAQNGRTEVLLDIFRPSSPFFYFGHGTGSTMGRIMDSSFSVLIQENGILIGLAYIYFVFLTFTLKIKSFSAIGKPYVSTIHVMLVPIAFQSLTNSLFSSLYAFYFWLFCGLIFNSIMSQKRAISHNVETEMKSIT